MNFDLNGIFKSRKFLVGMIAPAIMWMNRTLNWGMTEYDIKLIMIAALAWIGAAAATDSVRKLKGIQESGKYMSRRFIATIIAIAFVIFNRVAEFGLNEDDLMKMIATILGWVGIETGTDIAFAFHKEPEEEEEEGASTNAPTAP